MALAFSKSTSIFSKLPAPTIIRTYATHLGTSSAPISPRRQVTVTDDDGRVKWGNLSPREKAARTTQQTFNLGIVVVGVVMTGGVCYLLYDTVFSPDSKISHFNRAVDEVRANPRARELLGPSNKIRAFGEPTWNKWARARPIASSVRRDGSGREHLVMHFNVEGPDGKGVVNADLVRETKGSSYEYKSLTLDVPGNATIHLRTTDAPKADPSGFKFLGVQWK